MTRQDVKNAISNYLQNTPNVKYIGTFRPKQQSQFPSIVISLPKSKETRRSGQAPYGKKFVRFTAQLEVFTTDVSPDGSGQLTFDDLCDSIDSMLRQDPTLGGAVLSCAVEELNTTLAPPTLIQGQTIGLLAIKTFDVTVQVTG